MVVMITPVAFANINYYTYTVFAALNLLILVATYIFYPETAGRSLEEIDKIFEKSNPRTPWDVVKIAQELPHHNAILDEETGYHGEEDVLDKPTHQYQEDTATSLSSSGGKGDM
ncbi:glucose-inactivated glycerol proton symporter STL1 [Sugiyamaella lignohabitans]|uniref:Glucose-inactivated glycerol proton symporter STL1 n=1 Tax=Sugiyamaella lignohabitans TaxID=796027 RepID=A0A161HG80_9ASCO|nr:glucose-inactivated glycerol proton symporter STL1 [Sugiyamaella lignohabitans]ANB14700.1 glucose-inactivated glycerol proton symporter STL1 [Sugiyamaella lignohabitans]